MWFLLQVALCKHIAGRQKNVCVCVSVFLTRRVMYVKRVAQGYLQTPPPPTPGQDQWLLSQAMFFDKRVRVSSDR